MRRHYAAACALLLAFCGAVGAAPTSFADDTPPPAPTTTAPEPELDIGDFLLGEITKYRRETWRWEQLMRVHRTPASSVAERSNDREQRLLILNSWKRKAAKRRRQASHPPRLQAWLCIHRYERHPGMGWATATGNGFYGGLQMDISFQRTYGAELLRRKGTANRWTAIEQMWVAERAYRSGRGFYPWPNTARACGLI
jgi:resuscitation-promoting factor RpfA